MEVFKDPFYIGKMEGLRYRAAYRPKMHLLSKIVKNREKFSKKYLEKILDDDFLESLVWMNKEKGCCANSENVVEIFDTISMGKGIRAIKDLMEGEEIGCYSGELRRDKDEGGWMYNFAYALKGFCVDGENGGLMSYTNHSDSPNVSVIWKMHDVVGKDELHLVFRVNRNVKIGEELFIDYGEEYWNYAKNKGVIKTTRQTLITDYFRKN